MNCRLSLIFILLVNFSCSNERIDERKIIIDQTLSKSLDTLLIQRLDSSLLIHFEFESKIRVVYLNSFLGKNEQKLTDDEKGLVQVMISQKGELRELYRFENFKFRTNHIIEDSPQNKSFYNDKKYFGTLNLSTPLVNSKGNLASYYLAINCSGRYPNCSIGALIFVRKSSDLIWSIDKIFPLWEGT